MTPTKTGLAKTGPAKTGPAKSAKDEERREAIESAARWMLLDEG